MSPEPTDQSIGEAPLAVLVGSAEEEVRRLSERLAAQGMLADDPGITASLVDIRIRLLVAATRLEEG